MRQEVCGCCIATNVSISEHQGCILNCRADEKHRPSVCAELLSWPSSSGQLEIAWCVQSAETWG